MTDQNLPAAPEPDDAAAPAPRRAAWGLLMQQLAAARAGTPFKRKTPNPRPAGVVRPGSATDQVLQLMRAHPNRRWRRAQLLMLTGHTESAIDWALLYLRHQGLIEAEQAPGYAPRTLRYRLVEKARG